MTLYSKVQLLPKFKEYDADGNGFITLEEASYILENPPFNFPPSKVIFLLKHFDKDGNGKLDIEEFAGFYAEAKATSVYAVFFLSSFVNLGDHYTLTITCVLSKISRHWASPPFYRYQILLLGDTGVTTCLKLSPESGTAGS